MITVARPDESRKFYERARKGKMSFQRWVKMPNGDVEAEFKCKERQPNGDTEVLFTVSWVADTEEKLVRNFVRAVPLAPPVRNRRPRLSRSANASKRSAR